MMMLLLMQETLSIVLIQRSCRTTHSERKPPLKTCTFEALLFAPGSSRKRSRRFGTTKKWTRTVNALHERTKLSLEPQTTSFTSITVDWIAPGQQR